MGFIVRFLKIKVIVLKSYNYFSDFGGKRVWVYEDNALKIF
jgi:hypothetical protein